MCYKTDKIERFLECAFGSTRNDKTPAWIGNECCAHKNARNVAVPTYMPEFLIRGIRVIRGSYRSLVSTLFVFIRG